jgi:two-component system C4-dicarboxylate transport sensor histidine kinase DctB
MKATARKEPFSVNQMIAETKGPANNAHSKLLGYGFALGCVAASTLLTWFLRPVIEPSVFSMFIAAVMISAWYGGLGPGLLATVLAVLTIESLPPYLPQAAQTFHAVHGYVRLVLFTLVALLISSLTGARKRAEEGLREAQAELERRVEERTAELAKANRELWRLQSEIKRVEPLAALGQVTGTIAHELGTPLNSVLGYTQLLVQDGLSENARRRVDIIRVQVERMVEIINHYLTNVRSSFQKQHRVHINQLIEETLVMFKPIFQQHRVEVRTELAKSLPALLADGPSLQRVLINLFDNSIDAIKESGTVTIATASYPASGSKPAGVVVTVADTGMGISPDVLPKIFNMFVTTKPPGQGSGLGLAISQEIVKGHGGTIEVASELGKGTCARVFLPADKPMKDAASLGTQE